jgi:methionyl-tRNA synthetase
MERLVEKYNADLANGIGNLVSRVVKLSLNSKLEITNPKQIQNSKSEIQNFVNNLELSQALEYIWNIIRESNKYIEDNKPWELAKTDVDKFEEVMKKPIRDLYLVSNIIASFLPETSEKIKKALETKELVMLFQRIK